MSEYKHAIITVHGQDDVSIGFVNIPEAFFEEQPATEGMSLRGSLDDVANELATWIAAQFKTMRPTLHIEPASTEPTDPRERFYKHFEDCWDYTFNVFDRGLTYARFMSRYYPGVIQPGDPAPQHISQIPQPYRSVYLLYLRGLLAEHWGISVDTLVYTDAMAIDEFEDSREPWATE